MAFEDYEVSVDGGQPVELYDLALGNTTWRMHNSLPGEVISYSGEDYTATAVTRGSIGGAQENLTFTMPSAHPFALSFVTVAPGQLATLTVYKYHRADAADVHVLHKGVVRSISFSKQAFVTELTVIPLTATFDKTIPDRTFQAGCNHFLFDSRCQVNAAGFKYTGTVSAIVDNTVTVSGLNAAKGTAWADGSYAASGVLDFRLILGQVGDVCTLNLPFYEDVLGTNIDVYAGCDHTISTCVYKFGNEVNFGGCPYVPTKNIFVTGV